LLGRTRRPFFGGGKDGVPRGGGGAWGGRPTEEEERGFFRPLRKGDAGYLFHSFFLVDGLPERGWEVSSCEERGLPRERLFRCGVGGGAILKISLFFRVFF